MSSSSCTSFSSSFLSITIILFFLLSVLFFLLHLLFTSSSCSIASILSSIASILSSCCSSSSSSPSSYASYSYSVASIFFPDTKLLTNHSPLNTQLPTSPANALPPTASADQHSTGSTLNNSHQFNPLSFSTPNYSAAVSQTSVALHMSQNVALATPEASPRMPGFGSLLTSGLNVFPSAMPTSRHLAVKIEKDGSMNSGVGDGVGGVSIVAN